MNDSQVVWIHWSWTEKTLNDRVPKYLSLNLILLLLSPYSNKYPYSFSDHLYKGGFQIYILITNIFGTADLSVQLPDYTVVLF